MSDPSIISSEEILGGEPRIEETRIGVSHVVQYYEKGWNVEKISRELNLEPIEVIKALEYYYKNPEEVRNIIRKRESESSQVDLDNLDGEKA